MWRPECAAAFLLLRDAPVRSPILAYPTESGEYVLDTDPSNFGLGGVLSQIQNDEERVIAYCSRALRPSQRKYCTTKREMLAAVSMCIQFRSYLRGARFIIRTDHKSLVWLHRYKDTDGMMARWLHTLQQFQFSIVHRAGRDHSNAEGLSRVPAFTSALMWIAPGWTRRWRWWISRLMRNRWGTQRMLTSFPYSLEKIGLFNLMMTCPDRPLGLGRSFVSVPYNTKIPRASRC